MTRAELVEAMNHAGEQEDLARRRGDVKTAADWDRQWFWYSDRLAANDGDWWA